MKPNNLFVLPTRYRGIKYRSRTEARWAVFLTTLDWEFTYEPEGFSLPSGHYLPDFYVASGDFYLEVKGAAPTQRERTLCSELAHAAKTPVVIVRGAPDAIAYDCWFPPFECAGGGFEPLPVALGNYKNRLRKFAGLWTVPCVDSAGRLGGSEAFPAMLGAISASRNERFGVHP